MTPPAERFDPSPFGAPASRGAPPFVGRDAEVQWLRRSLDAALAGRPRVALVTGEAGIGKTRLLRELQTIASARAVAVAPGRGYEDLAVPFLPIAEALAPHVASMPAALARRLGVDGQVMRRLVHGEVTGPADRHRPWEAYEPRLFLAATHTVIELARDRPLLLMLDDLHWLDQGSLELFMHVVFAVADAARQDRLALLIVGSSRPVEPDHRLARAVARLQREDICETFELAGLDEDALARLVRGLGLARPSHQMIAAVNDSTHGNPLFVQEVIHHLHRHGAIREQGGSLVTAASSVELELPPDISAAIAARAGDLAPEIRRTLTLAAAMGDRICPETLAIVAGATPTDIGAQLDVACARGILARDGPVVQFAHPLLRHAFYAMPPPSRRQELHADIAAVLRRRAPRPTGDQILEIAHHLVAAGPAAKHAMVADYAGRAGDLAFARASWTEAARFYGAALTTGVLTLSLRDRAELHRLAGLAHSRDQDAGPCLAHYEQAIAGFREAGDLHGLARALMGRTRAQFTLASVSYGTLIDPAPLIEVADRLRSEDPVLCGFVRAEIAQVYWTARQPADARALAEVALEAGRAERDDLLAAEAHRALALVASQQLDPAGARRHLEDGLGCARRARDAWLESQLLQRLPIVLVWPGELDEATAVAREAHELTSRLHDWGDHSLAEGALVCLAVARGDFDAAERHARHALALIRRSRYPWAGPTALPALATAHVLRGTWHEAEEALALLGTPGEIFDDPGPAVQFFVFLLRQVVRAWTEDPTTLRAELRERLLPLAKATRGADAHDVYAVGTFGAIIDMAERIASPDMAATVYDDLARAAEHGVVVTSGWVCLVARALGSAATLLRRWEQAERWFDLAVAQATARGMTPELGRARLGQARMLTARGRRTDRPRAARLVDVALPLFERLAMKPLAEEARTLAAMLRTPGLDGRTATSRTLTRLQRTLLAHLARGHEDRVIARELVLRPAVLARHLRALFRTLAVSTREEAVARARLHGFAPEDPTPADRPVLAILFTDVAASTRLFDRLGDTAARELLRVHDDAVRAALRQSGGTERKHTGDGIMATFASIASALECGIALQRTIAAHNAADPARQIGVRVGINAGEPVAERGDVFGSAVTAAARICGRARPGVVLVSEVVRQLAAGQDVRFVDRGRVTLRGFTKRCHLFEVSW